MAVKKKTRSKAKAKKSNVGRNLLIIGALAGGAWAGWKWGIKPMLEKKKAEEEAKKKAEAMAKGGESAVSSAIQSLETITPNTLPPVDQKKNRLSPLGTPYNKINYNAPIFYGDKGAEVQYIQEILNKTSKQLNLTAETRGYTMPTVVPDGKFGKKTYALLDAYFDASVLKAGVTPKIATEKAKQQQKNVPIETTAQSFGSGVFSNVFGSLNN